MKFAGFLSESLKNIDYAKGWKVAIKYKNKVYVGISGQIHVNIIDRNRIPYHDCIPGYVDEKNNFICQFESDVEK